MRASFAAQRIPAGLGVRFERLVCFSSRLAADLQAEGLARLLHRLAQFRALSSLATAHLVCLGIAYESDSTSQSLAQHAIQTFGRPARTRLATEVLQQRGALRVVLLRVDTETGNVSDKASFAAPWIAHSRVLMGKSAPYILEGLARGMPFGMCSSAWPLWSNALRAAADIALLQQMGDKGSSNLPAMKHLAAAWAEAPGRLSGLSSCELHNAHNMKTMNPSVKKMAGRLFAMSNIMKSASFVDGAASAIERLCETTIRRLTIPPPEAEAHDLSMLVDTLYNLSADHHRRSGPSGASTLVGDLKALMSMPLFELRGQVLPHGQVVRVHYCWSEEAQAPCCASAEEASEKAALALTNFHLGSAFDRVTLSRFTNLGKARKRVLMGLAHQGLFFAAAVASASKSVDFLPSGAPAVVEIGTPAEELGAGASDLQTAHRVRCARFVEWLRSPEVRYQLGIAETAEAPAEALTYFFFGREGRPPSVREVLCPETSPIGVALAAAVGARQEGSLANPPTHRMARLCQRGGAFGGALARPWHCSGIRVPFRQAVLELALRVVHLD